MPRDVRALALLLALAAMPAAANPADLALTKAAQTAVDRRDAAAFDRLFCANAVLIGRGNVIRTLDQLRAAPGLSTSASAPASREWGRLERREIGLVAVVTGEVRQRGRYGSTEDHLTAVIQSRREGGGRCVALLQRAPGGLAAEGSRWDEAFQISENISRRPNRWLEQAASTMPPGRALDVGMGQGRNALYLAQQGWDVTGFDVSGEGLRLAREQANAQGLSINTVFSADTDFYFGRDQWNLVAFIYVGTRGFEAKAFQGLKPGGIVVAEAFRAAPGQPPAGAEVVHAPGEMRDRFKAAGFEILRYEEPDDVADYGNDRVPLVRLVARKPLR